MADTAVLAKLIAVLFLALGFFVFCYIASPRTTIPWLICLSPFQIIETSQTTSSVILTYVVAIAFIFKGKVRFLPMLGVILAILLIYLASAGLAHRATHFEHGLYIFNYVSALLLFYLVYNFVRETKDLDLIIKTLIILDIAVVLHGIIQVTVGPLSLFGLEEVRMYGPRRGEDARLSGPYGSVTLVADFFVMYIFFIAYLVIHTKSAVRRNLLYLLMAANLACLLMTANRGGFLLLIGGGAVFLYMFRSQLGMRRAVGISVSGIFLLVLMSVIVVNFTNYGLMYERLAQTEFEEGGLPDTRAGTWSRVIPRIAEKPLLGHGPRFRLRDDYVRPYYRGYKPTTFPHNLVLFLLYTVGFVGLTAYLLLFSAFIVRLRAAIRRPTNDIFVDGFVKLGLLLMVIFLVGQLKIEFLRFVLIDYAHFVFTFLAIWLAISDMVKTGVPVQSIGRVDHSVGTPFHATGSAR